MVSCHAQLCQIRDELGEPERADEHMKQAYEMAQALLDSTPLIAQNYAFRQMRRGGVEEARRVCDELWQEAVEREEDLGGLRALRMRIQIAAGEFEEAVAVARQLLEAGAVADRGYSLNLLSEALRAAERWPEALEVPTGSGSVICGVTATPLSGCPARCEFSISQML